MKFIPLSLSSAALLLLASCQSSPVQEAPSPTPQPAKPQVSAPDSSGFVTTASGLKYKVLSSGPAGGRSPTRYDSVSVHYRGTLKDGTVFDSSYDRGEPATFGVGQVIPGWTEALQLMKLGDKWMLHIPFNLAYGSQAVGDKIRPFSDLDFQVELLQIVGGR
jgi:FKBP-type peptidyl-prolyl cis-trans isomerase FklB